MSKPILFLILGFSCFVTTTWAQERIYGGKNAEIKPKDSYVVALLKKNNDNLKLICGGSLISQTVVLTAAHCFNRISEVSDFIIRVGSLNLHSGGDIKKILRIHPHEDYKPKTIKGGADYDIGLIFLASAVSKDVAQPIKLPKKDTRIEPNTMATVFGWGELDTGVISETLQQVDLPIVSQSKCVEAYTSKDGKSIITENMFCAGYMEEGGKDSCSGDSGGPLVVNNELVGIVSWGAAECALPEFPGVYTNVTALRKWITDNIKNQHDEL